MWEGDSEDRPGILSDQLAEIMRAGASLEIIVSRPSPRPGGPCKVLLGPLRGEEEAQAARYSGLTRNGEHWLRLEGPDRPWLAAGIARTVADHGINISSFTGAAIAALRDHFVRDRRRRRAAKVLRRYCNPESRAGACRPEMPPEARASRQPPRRQRQDRRE